jgi:serine phosphatase RsbU (regulator of sigma subunit)/anti-sigma regulatory factor (Ser/Thr protein kinase)
MPSSMAAPLIKFARPAALRMAFSSDHAAAREVSIAVRGFLAEQGMPEKELFSYELCIAEACYNAIEYAKDGARDLRPVAEVLFSGDLIELRATDHTPGFSMPERIPQPSPQNERGRGLFIIHSVMDEVRYLRGSGENTLIMRKRRRSPELLQARQREPSLLQDQEDSRQQMADAKRTMDNMAGELATRSEMLSAVFRCCAEMGRGDEAADGFGDRLLSDLLHLTSANWYVVRLVSGDGQQLVAAAVSDAELDSGPVGLNGNAGPSPGFEASVAEKQAPLKFSIREGAGATEPLAAIGPEGSGMVHPLVFGGTLVGTIAVGRRDGIFPLERLHEEVIETFSEFLAIQILNVRRRKDEARDRVVAREMEIAKEIQHMLLPRTLPQLAGFGLAGGWTTARELGGDFYDAIKLGGQSLLLMMADVMGKGVPAALFATTLRGLLRGLASRSADPAQLLTSLNRLLYKDLSSVNLFMTVQIVHVDAEARKVTAAAAGHCPLLIVQPGYRIVSALTTQGIPIGVLPETSYVDVTGALESPATLLLHTDGLTEMRDSHGEMFGQRRLMAWLRANVVSGRSASEIRDLLKAELDNFRGEAAMADDQAFLVLSEEQGGHSPSENRGKRRIRLQPGSFLFQSNS